MPANNSKILSSRKLLVELSVSMLGVKSKLLRLSTVGYTDMTKVAGNSSGFCVPILSGKTPLALSKG